MKAILRNIANQMGAFAFLLSLALKPRVLTAAQSGNAQLFALLPSTVLCLIAMGLWSLVCIACCFLPERAKRPFLWLLGPLQVASPAGAAVLLVTVQAPFVPIAVSIAFGITCVTQVFLASQRNRLDSKTCLLSVGLTFCVAGLISDLAFTLLPISMYGNIVIALIMTASGATLLRQTDKRHDSVETEPPRAIENTEMESEITRPNKAAKLSSLRDAFSRMGALGFAIVFGNVMCSLSLGTTWVTNVFDNGQPDLGLAIAGTALGAVFAFSLYKLWPKLTNDAWLVYAFLVPLSIAFLLFTFSDCHQSKLFVILGLASEYCFFTIIWSSMFVLDRSLTHPGLIAVSYFAVFVLLLACSITLCSTFGDVALRRVFSIATLAFLLWLVHFSAKRNPSIPSLSEPATQVGASTTLATSRSKEDSTCARSIPAKPGTRAAAANSDPVSYIALPPATDTGSVAADVIVERCARLAEENDLSPRETELLPFFVMGFSAASIGKQLFISPETVKTHRSRIYRKIGVSKHEDLVKRALNLPK